jgi:CheY-like chemotaxis protein
MPGSRVLIVDDNKDTRHMIKVLLEVCGYEVAEAANGESATRLARKLKPQLILMDLMMSHVDGFDATKRIRRIKEMAHVPIIVLSAYVCDFDIKHRAIKVGANECLEKPSDIKKLKSVIGKYLPAAA